MEGPPEIAVPVVAAHFPVPRSTPDKLSPI